MGCTLSAILYGIASVNYILNHLLLSCKNIPVERINFLKTKLNSIVSQIFSSKTQLRLLQGRHWNGGMLGGASDRGKLKEINRDEPENGIIENITSLGILADHIYISIYIYIYIVDLLEYYEIRRKYKFRQTFYGKIYTFIARIIGIIFLYKILLVIYIYI